MFSYHMSYTELLSAFHHVAHRPKNGGVLTDQEWSCLSQSLSNPFLTSLLSLYPLPNRLRKIINTTIEHQRAQRPQENQANPLYDNVHAAIYGDSRGKTERWLGQEFPPVRFEEDLIERLQDLVKRHVLEGASQDALLAQEKDRLKERERKSSPKQSLYSFEEIQRDFQDYLDHIQTLKSQGSTYGFAVLASIFARIDSLEGEAREDAERALICGLDDGRTGYHADQNKYVAGKDYSCAKGWEERMLDVTTPFLPQQSLDLNAIDQTVMAMTAPFVHRDPETQARFLSPQMYAAYLDVAGVTTEQRVRVERTPKDAETLQAMKAHFVQTQMQKNPDSKEATQQNLFDRYIHIRQVPSGLEEDQLYDTKEYTESVLCLPETQRSEEEIIAHLQARFPGLGREHTLLLLSLTAHAALEPGSFSLPGIHELQTRAKNGEDRREELPDQATTPDALSAAYQQYLGATGAAFSPFFCEELIQILQRGSRSLPCSEGALLEALDRASLELSPEQAQKIAVLCAKEGYALALSRLFLASYSVDPEYADRQERQSLMEIAIKGAHPHVVAALIQARPDPNFIEKKYGYFQENALILAIKGQSAEIVQLLLAHNSSQKFVESRDKDGRTALHIAASSGSLEGMRLLLERSSSQEFVEAEDKYGRTAFHAAASRGNLEGMSLLLERSSSQEFVEAKDKYGRTAFHAAASSGNLEVMRLLLEQGLSQERVEAQDSDGWTALHTAASIGNLEGMRLLLEQGPSQEFVEARDTSGQTALHIAASSGNLEGMRLLLERRFSQEFVEATDKYGRTALNMAASIGNLEGMRHLLEQGLSQECIEAKDPHGQTALHAAASSGNLEGMRLLLELDSSQDFIEAQDGHGTTALHYVVEASNITGTRLLLECNSSQEFIEAKDSSGRTALDYAASIGNREIIQLLSEYRSRQDYEESKESGGPVVPSLYHRNGSPVGPTSSNHVPRK